MLVSHSFALMTDPSLLAMPKGQMANESFFLNKDFVNLCKQRMNVLGAMREAAAAETKKRHPPERGVALILKTDPCERPEAGCFT